MSAPRLGGWKGSKRGPPLWVGITMRFLETNGRCPVRSPGASQVSQGRPALQVGIQEAIEQPATIPCLPNAASHPSSSVSPGFCA